jgi:hypothetical protein
MTAHDQNDEKANDAQPAKPAKRILNQHTINLTPDLVANLDRLAGRLGCHAVTGPKAGQPSWRTMLRYIALGLYQVRRPSQFEDAVTQAAAAGATPKERKPFRLHFTSPPKWWPADTGVMDRAEFEAKTKLGEAELLEMGWTLTGEGTLWRCPRKWWNWQPMRETPEWWDDLDGSGGMAVENVPEGVDVLNDPRFMVAGGLVFANVKGGGK